jgi:hypothetical protein
MIRSEKIICTAKLQTTGACEIAPPGDDRPGKAIPRSAMR